MPLLEATSLSSIPPLHENGNVVFKDGSYEKEDFLNRLHQSIVQYDEMVETYHENTSEI